MSILSDRIDNARLTEGVLVYLASVGLVAAAIIVLFSVASFSLLGTSKETLTGSRIGNNPNEDVSIATAVFYPGSNTAPVPVQTKLPSSSEANNLPPATLVPPPSGMSGEGTTVEPALKPLPHGETSAIAVETPHGSTRGPPTEEASPPEPSGSQQVIAQPLSIAAETSTAVVETPFGSTVGPSTDEPPPARAEWVATGHSSASVDRRRNQRRGGRGAPRLNGAAVYRRGTPSRAKWVATGDS
jgi:hypothetical protein